MIAPYCGEALIDACAAFTGPQEGNILWPYRDSAAAGNATVGRGHLLYSAAYAANVFGVSLEILQPQWDDLIKVSGGKVASFYETLTDLRISPEKSDALFRTDLDCHADACRRKVKGFDALPGPVQVACVDINFNARGGISTFPHFLACIAQGDWENAALQSNRPQLVNRSLATAALIRSVLAA